MNKKFSTALSLAVIAAMLITSLALADNIHNDVIVGGNDTITAGGSTTINYYIQAIPQDGQTGGGNCNANDGSAATVTINTPAGVTVDTSGAPGNQVTLTFTSCGTNQSAIFSSSTPGDHLITVSVSDAGAGSYNVSPATFTLHVLTPPPPADTTAPTASPNLSGTAGNNGWYTGDVTVAWNWSDNTGGSGIDTNSCPATSTSSGEGALIVSADCYDLAGNKGTASVNVNVDKTAPTISFVGPSTSAWYNADVTASWSCTDATSGPVSNSVSALASGEGIAISATGTCVDNAGLSANDTQSFKIDKTAPSVSLVGGPANGGNYYFGSVPAMPTCNASDTLSGLNGTCSVSGYSAAVGSHTVTASASDMAGNARSASASYTVLAWTLSGFYAPVDMGGVYNTVKGGSTVPLKFEVFAGPTELTATSAVTSFIPTRVACDGSATFDDIELTSTGGTSLRYDTTGGQFIQNWQTPRQAGVCYRVTLTTQDGSSLVAFFKLK